jgi:hypothetical protein
LCASQSRRSAPHTTQIPSLLSVHNLRPSHAPLLDPCFPTPSQANAILTAPNPLKTYKDLVLAYQAIATALGQVGRARRVLLGGSPGLQQALAVPA